MDLPFLMMNNMYCFVKTRMNIPDEGIHISDDNDDDDDDDHHFNPDLTNQTYVFISPHSVHTHPHATRFPNLIEMSGGCYTRDCSVCARCGEVGSPTPGRLKFKRGCLFAIACYRPPPRVEKGCLVSFLLL
jgi:hypothetical protein